MQQVARHAGVSQKTVSRVVNGEPHVAEEMRARVHTSIGALGYRRNAAARALATHRTRRIGAVTFGDSWHGPAAQLAAIENTMRTSEYSLTVARTESASSVVIQDAIDRLVDDGAEGIILHEPVDFGPDLLHVPQNTVVLTFGNFAMTDSVREHLVAKDEFQGARDATEHLLGLGHRTVHHIGGPNNWIVSRERSAGWRAALQEARIPPPAPVAGDWSPRGGFEAMRQLLDDQSCTAVFAANDHMAVGAVRAVLLASMEVPRDISIVGFDDIDLAAYLPTPLTTVHQDFADPAHVGIRRMIDDIEGTLSPAPEQTFPTPLIIRSTTAGPRSSAHHAR